MRSLDKRAALGEGVLMLYRFLLLAAIAFAILGISAVFYPYYVDVRDAEAQLMARQLVDCVSPRGIIDVNAFSETDKRALLSYCNTGGASSERFFVKVALEPQDDDLLEKSLVLQQGDSGAIWIKDFFDSVNMEKGSELARYAPGYFTFSYPVRVAKGEDIVGSGELQVEVFLRDDD